MGIETASFIVQKGASTFSCVGSDLGSKLDGSETLVVQDPNSDTSSSFKLQIEVDVNDWQPYSFPYIPLNQVQGSGNDFYVLFRDVVYNNQTNQTNVFSRIGKYELSAEGSITPIVEATEGKLNATHTRAMIYDEQNQIVFTCNGSKDEEISQNQDDWETLEIFKGDLSASVHFSKATMTARNPYMPVGFAKDDDGRIWALRTNSGLYYEVKTSYKLSRFVTNLTYTETDIESLFDTNISVDLAGIEGGSDGCQYVFGPTDSGAQVRCQFFGDTFVAFAASGHSNNNNSWSNKSSRRVVQINKSSGSVVISSKLSHGPTNYFFGEDSGSIFMLTTGYSPKIAKYTDLSDLSKTEPQNPIQDPDGGLDTRGTWTGIIPVEDYKKIIIASSYNLIASGESDCTNWLFAAQNVPKKSTILANFYYESQRAIFFVKDTKQVWISPYGFVPGLSTSLNLPSDDKLLVCTDTDGTTYQTTGLRFKELFDSPDLVWDVFPTILPQGSGLTVDRLAIGGTPSYIYTDDWEKYLTQKIGDWTPHNPDYAGYYGAALSSVKFNGINYNIGSKRYSSHSINALDFTLFENSPGYDANVPNFSETFSHFIGGASDPNIYMCTNLGLVYGNKNQTFKYTRFDNIDRWVEYDNTTNSPVDMEIKSMTYTSENKVGTYIVVGFTDLPELPPGGMRSQFATVGIIVDNSCIKQYSITPRTTKQPGQTRPELQGMIKFITKDIGAGDEYYLYMENRAPEREGWYKFTESRLLNSYDDQSWNNLIKYKVADTELANTYATQFSVSTDGKYIGYLLTENNKGTYYAFDGTTVTKMYENAIIGDLTDPNLGFVLQKDSLKFGSGIDTTQWLTSQSFPTVTKGAVAALTDTRLTVLGDKDGYLASQNCPGYTTEISEGWYPINYSIAQTSSSTKYKVTSTVRDSGQKELIGESPEYTKS